MPKYPNITVQLTGEDGNIFHIVARVNGALAVPTWRPPSATHSERK